MHLSRRQYLKSSAAAGLAGGLNLVLPGCDRPSPGAALTVENRVIDVNGRAASVFGIARRDGGTGVTLDPGQRFQFDLRNDIDEPTLIHWHGQTPPTEQDGVPNLSQPALKPGGRYRYDYAPRAGTHWMHAHYGLQEQRMAAGPLIVRTAEDVRADVQEAVVLLHDFTFRDPDEILADLMDGGHGMAHGGNGMPMQPSAPDTAMSGGSMDHGAMSESTMTRDPAMRMQHAAGTMGQTATTTVAEPGAMPMDGMAMEGMAMDLNDVEYDAFLANDRTLEDPEIVRVEPGARVRLRFINAASSTNFHLYFGALDSQVVAVDGNPVVPLPVGVLPVGMAQRVDILVTLPARQGAWPVLALREGGVERTGIVLATPRGRIERLASVGDKATNAIAANFEIRMTALTSLTPRPTDHHLTMRLTGSMTPYRWGIDGRIWGEHERLEVQAGDRVELAIENRTMMSHPMHLHGHHFQVVEFGGVKVAGAVRDTVVVPANGRVAVAFDADNPGRWALHCHNLYHMAAGMMTELFYLG